MEPISTSVMIGSIVSYLGAKLAKNESVNSFLSDFTSATVNWIKPLFLKEDGEEKESLAKYRKNPGNNDRKDIIVSMLKAELADTPEAANYIKEIFEKISKTEEGGKIVNNIIGSKNVNTGNVNTGGGDFIIGDNNK